MADNEKFYVIRGDKVLIESMTKEEIYNAIVQAVEQGEIGDIDKGFITSIKEQNKNNALKFWHGTNAEYNALQSIDPLTYYIITDDTFKEDVNEAIEAANEETEKVRRFIQDIMIKHGDTIEISSVYVNGTVTGQGKTVVFTLPINRPILNGVKVGTGGVATSCICKGRQNGNYVIGNATTGEIINFNKEWYIHFTSAVINDCGIVFTFIMDEAPAGIINNAEIALVFSNFTILFE